MRNPLSPTPSRKPLLTPALIAEAVGTFFIVFSGCFYLSLSSRLPGQASLALMPPFIFGVSVMLMVLAFSPVSGAHFNPAVSLALSLSGKLPFPKMAAYGAAQCFGALAACGLLKVVLPRTGGEILTSPDAGIGAGLAAEVLLTFVLMLVIKVVSSDERMPPSAAAFMIGSAVSLGAWTSGASMNPARSLAPAILLGNFHHLWIYFTGPCLGALLAVFFHGLIFKSPEPSFNQGNSFHESSFSLRR